MSGEGMSTDRAPFFDGTSFPRWKVLMQAHLQARGLDVWRVTEVGMKNENKAERQYDDIAKSILLSSLCDSVFNRVFANENAHKLWKQIVENHEGTKDVANQKYHILGEELSSFKQLPNENAHDMYSRLNTLVNEINALGLNQVDDGEINRKILRSLRKPDYNIINTILQKEDLVKLTPNQVINQIIAHEYSMGMTKKKEQESTSSSSKKSLAAKHSCKHQPRRQDSSSSSESEQEEEDDENSDDESSSSDEEYPRAVLYHNRKITKHVHELYELGYKTLIKGSAVGMEKMAKKKNKSRAQALSAIHKPKKSGKSSRSKNIKDSKSSTTRRPRRFSPPPMCLMAQGNSYVSDDDSSNDESDVETDETSEMMTLLHNQQEHLIKQNKEIKTLKAKEKLHASFVSIYENLLNKFNLLDNELKRKYESLESKSRSSLDKSFPCNIPCAIPIIKVDASTSCLSSSFSLAMRSSHVSTITFSLQGVRSSPETREGRLPLDPRPLTG